MKTKVSIAFLIIFMISAGLLAQESQEELAKAAQNPLANIMSFPFQNNTNFGYGPQNDRTQNLLNIQPVLPFFEGRLITRTIFPLLWQPDFPETSGSNMGLSNVQFTAFYAPKSKGITWGVGPILSFPAGSSDFGSKKWSAGPSIVVLKMGKKWVYGFLINNVWSFAGDSDASDVNSMLFQYFLNYNLKKGMYFTMAPVITANWMAAEGQQWSVPFGIGFGKIVKLGGKLPINMQAGYYYNVISPDFGPKSQLRVQVQVMLPTSILKKGKK